MKEFKPATIEEVKSLIQEFDNGHRLTGGESLDLVATEWWHENLTLAELKSWFERGAWCPRTVALCIEDNLHPLDLSREEIKALCNGDLQVSDIQ